MTVRTCESTIGRLVTDSASRKGRNTNKEVDLMDSVGDEHDADRYPGHVTSQKLKTAMKSPA